MWTSDETVFTTTSMTSVSRSMRSDHDTSRPPDCIHWNSVMRRVSDSPKPKLMKAIHDRTAAATRKAEVVYSDALAPIALPNRPAIRKPASGRRTMV